MSEQTDKDKYKKALLGMQQFVSHVADSVLKITDNDVKFICYQTASQNIEGHPTYPAYQSTTMAVPTAQMELVRDNNSFIASCPVYILDHSEREAIHLSSSGEKLLGMYAGVSLFDYLQKGRLNKGFTFKDADIDDKIIHIHFNIPNPPIIIDNTWVADVDNYGFSVINSEDKNIISSVKVYSDHIDVSCLEDPNHCKLYYGYNGVIAKDGRLQGSRGNIKDFSMRKGVYNGAEVDLSNWLYSFEKYIEK